ncbi:MAG: hypothetical protein IIA23_00575 [Chloroflexi bacterium]|nr:hypothetical protein [Chloroflexota bacterium]
MLADAVPADAFALAVVDEDEPQVFIFAPASLCQEVTTQIRVQLSEAADLVIGRELPASIPMRFELITGEATEVKDVRSHVILPLTPSDAGTAILGGMFSGKARAFKSSHVTLFSTVAVSIASSYLACLVRAKERELQRRQSEFVSTASHELRTPLHSIRGFTRLLLDGNVPDLETQREFLTIIDEQSEALSELVNNLLDVARIEAGRMEMRKEPLSLDDLVGKTIARFGPTAEERAITIETDLPPDLPAVEGDIERLGQVLANLVGNAVKFSEGGGTVTVRARTEGPELVVSVQDHGIGIPQEALPRLFERFYQANSSSTRSRGGTGLGLYISKQIVEAHQGWIRVESAVGQGSTFSFAIPIGASGSKEIEAAKAA